MRAPLLSDCTGVLLAGGRAERLNGIPKGLLLVDGQALVDRTLSLFSALFPAALLVADDAAPYAAFGARVVPDRFQGRGAPGGLEAGLRAASTPWVFAAACDMPFLAEGPIRLLAARRRPGLAAVLVRAGGRLHPLHALWSKECLPALERLLREGAPSLRELAAAVPSLVVEEEEWALVDPGGRALENANTPADLARLGLGYQL